MSKFLVGDAVLVKFAHENYSSIGIVVIKNGHLSVKTKYRTDRIEFIDEVTKINNELPIYEKRYGIKISDLI